MVRMISKTPHMYAGQNLREDDEFDCDDSDVNLLMVLGRADLLALDVNVNDAAVNAQAILVRSASQRAILKRRAP